MYCSVVRRLEQSIDRKLGDNECELVRYMRDTILHSCSLSVVIIIVLFLLFLPFFLCMCCAVFACSLFLCFCCCCFVLILFHVIHTFMNTVCVCVFCLVFFASSNQPPVFVDAQ